MTREERRERVYKLIQTRAAVTFGELTRALGEYRPVDHALQALRRQGKIEFRDNRWHATEEPEVEIVEVGPRTSLSERLRSAADRGTTLPDALQKDDLPPLWLRRLLHEAADALEPKRWPPEDDSLVIAYIPGEGWGTDRRSDVEEWAEAGGLPVPTHWRPLPDPPEGGDE